MGLDGNQTHPSIWKGLDDTVRLCKPKGLPVANLCWDIDSAAESIKRGALMIALGVDLVIFRQGLQALNNRIEKELRNL
jgi:2-keto-3-deoxy-L-rhamnonate aldolase RhmA